MTAPAMRMHVCDNCEGTYTATWTELFAHGWRKHKQGNATFVMCDDCEDVFSERRRIAKAAEAA